MVEVKGQNKYNYQVFKERKPQQTSRETRML